LPTNVLGEAASSLLGAGVRACTPMLGKILIGSVAFLASDRSFFFFLGLAVFGLVLERNPLGEALCDAFDATSERN
jgi:ABC-type dipeptide/oligopeptide/nickel transport system permease subunit